VINELPDPVLTPVYRLKVVLGTPLECGDDLAGHRRVVPLADGMFTGPALDGNLLRTDSGALLNVPPVLARATPRWPRGWGEVRTSTPASTFRAATHIETAAPCLDWLNKGVFTTLAGRKAAKRKRQLIPVMEVCRKSSVAAVQVAHFHHIRRRDATTTSWAPSPTGPEESATLASFTMT
jgi:hypothetical protein